MLYTHTPTTLYDEMLTHLHHVTGPLVVRGYQEWQSKSPTGSNSTSAGSALSMATSPVSYKMQSL